ncbi:MAG: WS/DGAT domain-containing protein [Pirellulales bacterium]
MTQPLPLTPFEEYMLCDDRPAHPMTGFFRLRFSGRLERPSLEAALRLAVSRHPLTHCKVQSCGGKLAWVPDDGFSLKLECCTATPDRQYPRAGAMDLTAAAGTRCWLVERPEGHDLVVQMHHSVTDALGMCQFIEDVLLEYARLTGTAEAGLQLREMDESKLPGRNKFGLTWGQLLRLLPRQMIGLLGARQALMRRPSRLLPECEDSSDTARSPGETAGCFPSPRTFVFSPGETREILQAAKRRKVTVNDLLARDLFLAVGELRKRAACETPRDWLRFSVPMNLRTPDDERLSVANVVSMIFLDRRPADLDDADKLLRSIQDEMQLIKRNRLSLTFVLSLAVARLFPGGVRKMVPDNRCWATAIFSNLGVIFTNTPLPRRDGKLLLGDVTLDELDFVTPLRPHTAAACCIYTYAGRLFVMMHCDPRSLSDGQTDELMAGYVARIRESIHTGSVAQSPNAEMSAATCPS